MLQVYSLVVIRSTPESIKGVYDLSLARSTLLFSSGTLLSRMLGLVRDMIVAATFGAGVLLDSFFVALRIPNLFREMLAEGSLGNAFTKTFSALMAEDRERAERLLIDTLYFFTLASCLLCVLGVAFAPLFVNLLTLFSDRAAHGPELVRQATGLARILFPVAGLMIIGSVAMGALHQQGRFFLTATAPMGFNVGYILGAAVLAEAFTRLGDEWIEALFADRAVVGLACGVLLGAMLQMGVQVYALWRPFLKRLLAIPQAFPWSRDLRHTLLLMLPMVFAASAGQINQLIITTFSTQLEAGTVTWLYASFRLLHLPVGLFGVAVGVAVLPMLSRSIKDRVVSAQSQDQIYRGLAFVLWLMAPVFAFYIANAEAIVTLLFMRGKFDPYAVHQTSLALLAYSPALFAYGINKVMQSFFFAVEKTGYALKVSFVTVGVNVVLMYFLVDRFAHVGLAAAFALSMTCQALLLFAGARSAGLVVRTPFLLKNTAYAGAALATTLLAQQSIAAFQWPAALQLGVNGIVITVVFACAVLVLVRMRPREALAAAKDLLKTRD